MKEVILTYYFNPELYTCGEFLQILNELVMWICKEESFRKNVWELAAVVTMTFSSLLGKSDSHEMSRIC